MDTEEYRSIISNAIEREIESYTFYRTVREKVTDEICTAIPSIGQSGLKVYQP